jgi:hypothetical protein
MEKWKRTRLVKWWYISDHLGQIGLDMGTERLDRIGRRHSGDHDLFAIGLDWYVGEES